VTHHPFRAHEDIPSGVASPLFRRLIAEWVDLNALPSTATTLRSFTRVEPVLAGCEHPAEVLAAIDAADPEHADALLLALVRLAQGGHALAGRIVLHALLPKLSTIAARTRPTGTENTRLEDRRHITVAEAWAVIVTYPAAARTHGVAGNLTLDTLRRVTTRTRDRYRSIDQEVLYDPATLPDGACHDEHALAGDLTPDADLAELLDWALRQAVLTPQEVELLRLVYTPDPAASGARSDAAAQRLGLTPATVRQRCARARRRLTDAVRAECTLADTTEDEPAPR